MTRRSWLLFAAMCVIWGIPYLLIRIAVRDLTPGTLVFARTAIGGLVLLPLALTRGGFGPVLRRWRPLVAFTALELAGPWLMLGSAEERLSSSLAGLLVAATPLVGVIVARLLRVDDRVNLSRAVGLVLGIVGVAMLVGLDVGQLSAGPLLEVLGVVIGYAVAPVILDRKLSDLPSIPVVSAALLLCALAYLPYAVLRPPAHLSGEVVGSVAVLGLVCTATAFVVFFALIASIGPARATVITYVNPAVAVLLGVGLLGEHFTLGMGVGFPLILAGSVLAARKAAVREPAVAEPVAPALADPAPPAVQSSRTSPPGVLNTAESTPVSSSIGGDHSTSIPSSG
ncbi:MAG TPA: DMT family transporter [Jatrophihabitantaceae bacterium]|jgi:drug/metabolite transporter (DMT)-like permease